MSKEKNKGRTGENEVVNIIKENSRADARRVPLSGSLSEHEEFKDFSDDIDIILPDGTLKKGESKFRQSVPKSVYSWLKIKVNSGVKKIKYILKNEHEKPPDYLFMRRNNSPWIVCMSIDQFIELINKIKGKDE